MVVVVPVSVCRGAVYQIRLLWLVVNLQPIHPTCWPVLLVAMVGLSVIGGNIGGAIGIRLFRSVVRTLSSVMDGMVMDGIRGIRFISGFVGDD